MNKLLNVLRVLLIIWIVETLIAFILYSVSTVASNNTIGFIFYINNVRFIYYYWLLLLIYLIKRKYNTIFFTVTNSVVFIIISLVLSITVRGASDLFLDYSFYCNFAAIIFTPYLLKMLTKKMPLIFDIYKNINK
jgi:hypothetical protein